MSDAEAEWEVRWLGEEWAVTSGRNDAWCIVLKRDMLNMDARRVVDDLRDETVARHIARVHNSVRAFRLAGGNVPDDDSASTEDRAP